MARHQLVAYGMKHIVDIEQPLLLGNLGVEHDVQCKVAELFFEVGNCAGIVGVEGEDGFAELVDLLNGKVADALEGLSLVPLARGSQHIHDGFKPLEAGGH